MTTKEIENIAYKFFWRKGWYGIFEVAVPRSIVNKYHRERLDFLTYETSGIFRAYEIKRNLSDFKSGCAWSWIGHYNYFIMPVDLYPKVKEYIPDGIGVWVVYDTGTMSCVKNPKRRELLCSKEDMLCCMLQGLSREYKKYRKLQEQINKTKKPTTNKYRKVKK